MIPATSSFFLFHFLSPSSLLLNVDHFCLIQWDMLLYLYFSVAVFLNPIRSYNKDTYIQTQRFCLEG